MAANELKAIVSHRSSSNIQIEEAAASGLLTYNDNETSNMVAMKKYTCLKYSCILTTLILIGLAIFTIYYVVENETSAKIETKLPNQFQNITNITTIQPTSKPTLPNISNTPMPTLSNATNVNNIQPTRNVTMSDPLTAKCQTDGCYKLAADILDTVNESADPCYNFYNYVCDGWREDNEWKLIETKQFSSFGEVNDEQKEIFLSVFTENTDPLQRYDIVNKAKIFFHSCYDSEIQEEDLHKQSLLKEFINMVNFSDFNFDSVDSEQWTIDISSEFQKAMSWTLRRQWQDLFAMNANGEGIILMHQQWNIWPVYNEKTWRTLMNETFIPLYQTQFGLTAHNAKLVADLVVNFMNQIANISTANFFYDDYDEIMRRLNLTTISKINELFGHSEILNYKQIMTDLFYCSSSDCVKAILYFEPGIKYFNDLIDLIESTKPYVVQYWLFTDILLESFGYVLNQPRFMDRTDYCFWLTLYEFPYIYGFIVNQKLYSSEKYKLALNVTNRVKKDGIIELMNNVHWLDAQSLNNSLLKANEMDLYVGLPPEITIITHIAKYYDEPSVGKVSDNLGFVENYALMKEFDVDIHVRIFQGEDVFLHLPWPSIFHYSDYFPWWLTGVNAFYSGRSIGSEKANFFCMPQTITQNPVFDVEFPILVNFASYGVIVGHEMTHGFDSSGSKFDWFGNENEMWTDATRQLYNQEIDCFVQQYSNIEVEPNIFCDGDLTKTENTADNGGMAAALNAYEIYKRQYSDDQNENDETRPVLPGLEYTEDQLWWISYARTWCNVFRPGYYNTSNYKYAHAPSVARVNGVVQNFPHFAHAFNCPVGSPMNPETKCGLWHDP